MDPKTFLELTEAALLKDIGERLHLFFSPESVEYKQIPGNEQNLYEKVSENNPRSAVLPLAQVNMVANVTFHLMAQQLAMLFHQRPEIDKDKVFQTTLDNVRRLVAYYTGVIKEGKPDENTDPVA